ncbi:MAG: hypothetical protein H0X31_02380 [Nostocaceae cyanobacterium]|nr:hypothetical protein [Nostocaceae cyanobacterium]
MARNEQKQSATPPPEIPDLKNDKAYVKLFSDSWQNHLTFIPQADPQLLALSKVLSISQHREFMLQIRLFQANSTQAVNLEVVVLNKQDETINRRQCIAGVIWQSTCDQFHHSSDY